MIPSELVRVDSRTVILREIVGKLSDGSLVYRSNFAPYWSKEKSSLLIESILMRIPIGEITLSFGFDWNGSTVSDGCHRLWSIIFYIEDRYPLSELEFFPDISGKTFSEISRSHQRRLEESRVRVNDLFCRDADTRKLILSRMRGKEG